MRKDNKILLLSLLALVTMSLSACWPGSWDWSFSGSGSGNLTIEDNGVENLELAAQYATSDIPVTLVPETPIPPVVTPTAMLSDPTPTTYGEWIVRAHSYEFHVHNQSNLAPTDVDNTHLTIEYGQYDAIITNIEEKQPYIDGCYINTEGNSWSAFEVRGVATFVIHTATASVSLKVHDGRFSVDNNPSAYNGKLLRICPHNQKTIVYFWKANDYSGTRYALRLNPEKVDDFIRLYYELINEHRLDETWGYLTDEFKTQFNASGYQPYAEWWNSVEWAEILNIQIVSAVGNTAEAKVMLKYHMNDGRIIGGTQPETYLFIWDSTTWRFHYQPAAADAATNPPKAVIIEEPPHQPTATHVTIDRHAGDQSHVTASATTVPLPTSTIAPASCTVTNMSWIYQDDNAEYRFEWDEDSGCAAMYSGPAPIVTGGQIRHQERRAAGRNVVEVTCGFLDSGDGRRCDDPGAIQITWIEVGGQRYTAGE